MSGDPFIRFVLCILKMSFFRDFVFVHFFIASSEHLFHDLVHSYGIVVYHFAAASDACGDEVFLAQVLGLTVYDGMKTDPYIISA